jgi:hypothetical protein
MASSSEIHGVGDAGAEVRTIDMVRLILYRRRAVGVECAHGLQTPGLAFHTLFLTPDDGFPLRVED